MSTIEQSTAASAIQPLSVNGVTIDATAIDEELTHHADAPDPHTAARHALAIRELLRQRAHELQMIGADATLDDESLDTLLARELTVPSATRDDCERYYTSHPANFRRNDIVFASHILFAVTEQTPLALIRQKAEATLQQVLSTPASFEDAARDLSNCPSAKVGGSLGQLLRGDSVPEFERALFDTQDTGVLPRLVNTRFGFHIVRVERRVDGERLAFESVEADIARFLGERVRHKAIQQYVSVLASRARIEGADLGAANGPLVQ
ncbi:peptidylprolyl isomerase [Burkholderia sp. SRS-W-2-2016]|uniref:peptidylprolyl isomerase n=1 Tax=Burkholderia sp. SRS-W-2-2016 TaxID=1926878 RepID=UPI00094AC676|nr:peptidylprolyl isomerase [Burkholderia sp. SRS-W-2-2016]OLL32069.1 peptidylprolyl isomerase [Burkholderia sp. SRS-W-2-2016]